MKLFELIIESAAIEAALVESGGELTPEIDTRLAYLDAAIPATVDRYAYVLDQMKMKAEHWKARAEEMTRYRRACERVVDRLETNLRMAMGPGGEIAGQESRFKLVACKKRLEINEKELSREYLMQVTTTVPDKERIRAALDGGESIQGAELVGGDYVRSVRVK